MRLHGFWERLGPVVRFGPAAGLLAVAKRLLRPWLELGTIIVFELPLRRAAELPLRRAAELPLRRAAELPLRRAAELPLRRAAELPLRRAAELPLRRAAELPALDLRALGGGDVFEVAAAFGRAPEALARRLARGDRGYCVFVDGEPIHMRWATTRPTAVPEVGLWLRPAAGTVYVYDVETRRGARGRRIAAEARAAMDDALAAEGFRAKVAYIRGDNHPMWRSVSDAPGPLRRLCRLGYLRRRGGVPWVLGRPRWPLTAVPPPSETTSAIV